MSISQTPSHVLFFNDTKLNFRSEGTWGKTLSTWQYNGHSDMTNGLCQWKPHASLSGWHLAVINFQSLFTLLWAPRGDQNRCRLPRKNWHGDFTLAGLVQRLRTLTTQEKDPVLEEIPPGPVSCPAIVLRWNLFILTPKPCLMESIRRVYPRSPIVRLSFWSEIKKSLPKLIKGVKTWNTRRHSYWGHLEFRGIFGLRFLLVFIAP